MRFLKIIAGLIFLLNSSVIYSQDPQLFDTTWNLHELIIGGSTTVPTNPVHLGELTFTDNENIIEVTNENCEKVYVGDITNYDENIGFELFDFVDAFGLSCEDASALDFLETHATFYVTPNNNINNPFNYHIESEGGEISLSITNGQNDIAIYRNVPLSVTNASITTIQLFYNSQTKHLSFSGLLEKTELIIYNLLGQQVLEATVKENEKILVSDLKEGVYLAQMSQDGKEHVIKFIKY